MLRVLENVITEVYIVHRIILQRFTIQLHANKQTGTTYFKCYLNITELQYAIGQKSRTAVWAVGAAAWPKCGSAISLRLVSLHMLPITQLYMLSETSVPHCGPAAAPAT